MGKGFKPDYFVASIFSIDPIELVRRGIRAVALDIDNTLVTKHTKDADEKTILLVSKWQETGLKLFLLSNASKHRVELFNRAIQLRAVENAGKPFKKGFQRIILESGFDASEICMIGDQLFTDVLGGNKNGFLTILTVPIHKNEPWYVKLKRGFEQILIGKMIPSEKLPIDDSKNMV